MRIEHDIKLDYQDVLFKPKRSTLKSRRQVDLIRSIKFKNSKQNYSGIPIMAANMDGVGTFEMADKLRELNLFTCLRKGYTVNELVEFFDGNENRSENTAMSIGSAKRDHEKFRKVQELSDGKVKYLCVDIANGYSEMFSDYIYELRTNYPDLVIIAGNVVTGDMTQELILNGADIIKCGIGPGSVCTTRIQTGVGVPQLSTTIECADAAHGLGAAIIADGGCISPGCVAKALGAGADFVMLGGMLAGHDEGGGEIIETEFITSEIKQNGESNSQLFHAGSETFRKTKLKKSMHFYGMSSETANIKHFGGLQDYRASEGKDVNIPYNGKVSDTIQEILGGLRSCCTYIGARRIKDMPKCTTFVRVNNVVNQVFNSYNI